MGCGCSCLDDTNQQTRRQQNTSRSETPAEETGTATTFIESEHEPNFSTSTRRRHLGNEEQQRQSAADEALAQMLWLEQIREQQQERELQRQRASLSEVRLSGLAAKDIENIGVITKFQKARCVNSSFGSSVRGSCDTVSYSSKATTPQMKPVDGTTPMTAVKRAEHDGYPSPLLLEGEPSTVVATTPKEHFDCDDELDAVRGMMDDEPNDDAMLFKRQQPSAVNATPDHIADNESEEEHECVLCLETLDEGCEMRQLLCGHMFHRQCVDEWLQRKRTCPMCQADVTTQQKTNTEQLLISSV